LLLDTKHMPVSVPFGYAPFYAVSFGERQNHKPQDLIKNQTWVSEALASVSRRKFCAFMYSKPIDFRNRLFDLVNSYKRVDALGLQRKNTAATQTTDRHVGNYNDLAVAKYQNYKFVIACENTLLSGYITEKIVSPMLAKSVPIYLGAPDISNHFNPKSFINVNGFPSWQACLEFIKQVDTDPKLYETILQEPWFHGNRQSPYFETQYYAENMATLMKVSRVPRSRIPSVRLASVSRVPRSLIPRVRLSSVPVRKRLLPGLRQRVPVKARKRTLIRKVL